MKFLPLTEDKVPPESCIFPLAFSNNFTVREFMPTKMERQPSESPQFIPSGKRPAFAKRLSYAGRVEGSMHLFTAHLILSYPDGVSERGHGHRVWDLHSQ